MGIYIYIPVSQWRGFFLLQTLGNMLPQALYNLISISTPFLWRFSLFSKLATRENYVWNYSFNARSFIKLYRENKKRNCLSESEGKERRSSEGHNSTLNNVYCRCVRFNFLSCKLETAHEHAVANLLNACEVGRACVFRNTVGRKYKIVTTSIDSSRGINLGVK